MNEGPVELTAADQVEALFRERIPLVFDEWIAAHDPEHGCRTDCCFGGSILIFGLVISGQIETPLMRFFLALPVSDDFHMIFASAAASVDQCDPSRLDALRHGAVYTPRRRKSIDEKHFERWLCKQLDLALDIAKARPGNEAA